MTFYWDGKCSQIYEKYTFFVLKTFSIGLPEHKISRSGSGSKYSEEILCFVDHCRICKKFLYFSSLNNDNQAIQQNIRTTYSVLESKWRFKKKHSQTNPEWFRDPFKIEILESDRI